MTRQEYEALWETANHRILVIRRAKELDSDGCTGVPDWFRIGCYEHDITYRTHADVYGQPLSRAEADRRLRWYILWRRRQLSWWRWLVSGGMAWWRWAGVRLLGARAWRSRLVKAFNK